MKTDIQIGLNAIMQHDHPVVVAVIEENDRRVVYGVVVDRDRLPLHAYELARMPDLLGAFLLGSDADG